MSAVYIVLSISSSFGIDIECHSGFMKANEKALEIAKAKGIDHKINKNPLEQKTDNSIIWVYFSDESNFIAVVFQSIKSPNKSNYFAQKGLSGLALSNPMPMGGFTSDGYQLFKQPPTTILDDPACDELPGGWDYNGKPITMAIVKSEPLSVRSYSDLNFAQTEALITARIKKRPNFSILVPGIGTFLQKESLIEIANKTLNAGYIMDIELNWLSDFLFLRRTIDLK